MPNRRGGCRRRARCVVLLLVLQRGMQVLVGGARQHRQNSSVAALHPVGDTTAPAATACLPA